MLDTYIDVVDFVVVGVTRGDWVGAGGTESIIVGNVGSKTSNARVSTAVASTGPCIDVGKESGSGSDVCGPSEPSSMSGIEIELYKRSGTRNLAKQRNRYSRKHRLQQESIRRRLWHPCIQSRHLRSGDHSCW